MVEYEEGQAKEVKMHDGSTVILKKLDRDYDPTNRSEAMRILEEANTNNWLITGLIYINNEPPSFIEQYNLPDEPLNRLPEERLRPPSDTMARLNDMMF
jgi:2-oxoglutarate ferredoxin oxidoreductase subunit beta